MYVWMSMWIPNDNVLRQVWHLMTAILAPPAIWHLWLYPRAIWQLWLHPRAIWHREWHGNLASSVWRRASTDVNRILDFLRSRKHPAQPHGDHSSCSTRTNATPRAISANLKNSAMKVIAVAVNYESRLECGRRGDQLVASVTTMRARREWLE